MQKTTARCRMPVSRLPYGGMKRASSRKRSWNRERTRMGSPFSARYKAKSLPLASKPGATGRLHDGLIPKISVMRSASGWTSGGGRGTEREIEFLYELADHAETRHLFAQNAVLEGVAKGASLVLDLSDVF